MLRHRHLHRSKGGDRKGLPGPSLGAILRRAGAPNEAAPSWYEPCDSRLEHPSLHPQHACKARYRRARVRAGLMRSGLLGGASSIRVQPWGVRVGDSCAVLYSCPRPHVPPGGLKVLHQRLTAGMSRRCLSQPFGWGRCACPAPAAMAGTSPGLQEFWQLLDPKQKKSLLTLRRVGAALTEPEIAA
jgi:hypothetical protein